MGSDQVLRLPLQVGVVAAGSGDIRGPLLIFRDLNGAAENGIQAGVLGGHGQTPTKGVSKDSASFRAGTAHGSEKFNPGCYRQVRTVPRIARHGQRPSSVWPWPVKCPGTR